MSRTPPHIAAIMEYICFFRTAVGLYGTPLNETTLEEAICEYTIDTLNILCRIFEMDVGFNNPSHASFIKRGLNELRNFIIYLNSPKLNQLLDCKLPEHFTRWEICDLIEDSPPIIRDTERAFLTTLAKVSTEDKGSDKSILFAPKNINILMASCLIVHGMVTEMARHIISGIKPESFRPVDMRAISKEIADKMQAGTKVIPAIRQTIYLN